MTVETGWIQVLGEEYLSCSDSSVHVAFIGSYPGLFLAYLRLR